MIRGQELNNERLYVPGHIAEVLADLEAGFSRYFDGFGHDKRSLAERYDPVIRSFDRESARYHELLDLDALEEYAYEPSAFRGILATKCPVIQKALNADTEAMEPYQRAFWMTHGRDMLKVTREIAEFGSGYARRITHDQYQDAQSPMDFGISELDTEQYTLPNVIGGGIRSHFLYNLYPHFFPYRSQSAIWALYFLTGRKDYGFVDSSEFLMVEATGTQQNFFYPYDLFTYYALHLYRWLKTASENLRYFFFRKHRYVYVDAFLAFITSIHADEINTLRPTHERDNY